MAQTISGVPRKHFIPRKDHILVKRYDSTQTDGGLHLPDVARVMVFVAIKVGAEVDDVREGDILILAKREGAVAIPEIDEADCAMIPEAMICGVIRGYDWRAKLLDEIRKADMVVGPS